MIEKAMKEVRVGYEVKRQQYGGSECRTHLHHGKNPLGGLVDAVGTFIDSRHPMRPDVCVVCY